MFVKVIKKIKNSNGKSLKMILSSRRNYVQNPNDYPREKPITSFGSLFESTNKGTKQSEEGKMKAVKEKGLHPYDELNRLMKEQPKFFQYKAKYSKEQRNEAIKKFDELFNEPIIFPDEVKEYLTEVYGEDQKDFDEFEKPKNPEYFTFDSEGELVDMNTKLIQNHFKLDDKIFSMMERVKARLKLGVVMKKMFDENDGVSDFLDWTPYEKVKGEKKTVEVREFYRKLIKEKNHVYGKKEFELIWDRYHNPIKSATLDSIVEDLPRLSQLQDEMKREFSLLQYDEYGVPKYDVNSMEFYDIFYPEVRDQILLELDDFRVIFDRSEDIKKLSHVTPEDFAVLSSEEKINLDIKEKFDEEAEKLNLFKNSLNEEKGKYEIDKAYLELQKTYQKKNEAIQEIQKLKSQIEYAKELKGESGEKVEENKKDSEFDTNDILKRIGIDPNKKRTLVKDWKHKPHEIIELEATEKKKE